MRDVDAVGKSKHEAGQPRVLVLNPNSSEVVTRTIRGAVAGAEGTGVVFEVEQLDDGPLVIESEADHEFVAPLVLDFLAERAAWYDGMVVACHGDPAVAELRRRQSGMVLGIGEVSMFAAAALAEKFGILSLGEALVARKWRQVRNAGLEQRCAAVEATGTGVLDGVARDVDLTPYLSAGRRAVAAGAGALVLGCAGMVQLRDALATVLQVPVVEPVTTTCLLAASVCALPSSATLQLEGAQGTSSRASST
jgi:allantoin racemase